MKTLDRTGIALVATVLFSAAAWAGAGPKGHSHSHEEV